MTQERVSTQARPLLCKGAGCLRRNEAGQPEQPLPPGLQLCPRCQRQLAEDLRRLPGLYDACGEVLGGGRTADGPWQRTSGGPLPGMPFNSSAADARGTVLKVLGSWAGLVAQARSVSPPARTARDMAAFLYRHVHWLSRHIAADDASVELARLVRAARRITEPAGHRRITVGSCPEAGCAGTLHALMRSEASAGDSDIRCDAQPAHRWTGYEWVRLGQRVRGKISAATGTAAPTWLSAADISRLWGIAPGSVYRLASEQTWRRRSHAGRTYYHEADVSRSLSERRTHRF